MEKKWKKIWELNHFKKCQKITEVSDSSVDDSNNRVTMFDKTGKSAMTAVVITELFSVPDEPEVVSAPPVIGFKPRIHTKCCNV